MEFPLTRALTHIPKEATLDRFFRFTATDQYAVHELWDLKQVPLASVLSQGPAISVLVFFGGAHAEEDRLWCGDSEKELPLWRKISLQFEPARVRILGAACPPVYGDGGYGKGRDRFLDPDPSRSNKSVLAAREDFVSRTQDLLKKTGDPFTELFFDIRFRALLNHAKDLPHRRVVESWEGYFRAPGDRQTYGVPVIWILSREGEVMCEPFWGNNYPDKIRYRYEDVARAIEQALATLEKR